LILLVETNFVLELAFLQEGHEHCEGMIELARQLKKDELELAIPAFSIGEAYHRQIGQESDRRALQSRIITELDRLSRTRPYAERTVELRDVTGFLEESSREDRGRLGSVLRMLLSMATVIPLTAPVIVEAFDLQRSRGLSPRTRWSTPPFCRTCGLQDRRVVRRVVSLRETATSPTTILGAISRASAARYSSSSRTGWATCVGTCKFGACGPTRVRRLAKDRCVGILEIQGPCHGSNTLAWIIQGSEFRR
jgi:hypothetical protein